MTAPKRPTNSSGASKSRSKLWKSFPERCWLIPENEILGTRYRHLLYGNYRSLFRIVRKTVYVLRVVHGARLLDSSMFED